MPGPDRELIQAAVQRIQKLSDDNWWALHASCQLMEADAWVGPTGDRFGQSVHNCQRELHMMLAQAVAMARDEAARAK
ncbi:hypothetical protein [Nonomuraea salmonea]|uniref:WXG100 family type VII secretion target n=1 Tax=Nonomuraea salmonea TaxID=46181 RepID=A0ABV5NWJ6_9ACTN